MPIPDVILPPEKPDNHTLYGDYEALIMGLCNQALRAQILKDQAEFERVWKLIEEVRKE